MRVSKLVVFPLVICAVISFAGDSALCNGGKGKKTSYWGEIQLSDDEECEFVTEIEQVLFLLNSVQNKYKVVRIKITNHSTTALALSKEKDEIELCFDDETIPGILNLSEHDPTLWDAFDDTMRTKLAYPQVVEPLEEENIFVFIPYPELGKLPQLFRYTIDSLPEEQVKIYNQTLITAE